MGPKGSLGDERGDGKRGDGNVVVPGFGGPSSWH
jgi:hypothetical protein